MKRSLFPYVLFFASVFICGSISAQVYSDYIGAGHDNSVIVTSSDNYNRPGWVETASGSNTINGSGMYADWMASSRFLAQCTFGSDLETIKNVSTLGYEPWIDQQMAIPHTPILSTLNTVFQEIYDYNVLIGTDPEDLGDWPRAYDFNIAWWETAITQPDQLRQRVALALSEILVVSNNSDLSERGRGVADFYDIFLSEAFGNYENILREVTLHPSMGFYLSHFNNPKSDPTLGTHPDENYAREVMQLFSIGLYELNNDGSRILDGDGDFIPTYDQLDIKEFAKVFTGLGAGAVYPGNPYHDAPFFGMYWGNADMTVPMAMYDNQHEPGPKYLLNGAELDGTLSGMDEVLFTVNHLFNHNNVGPFVSFRLIQNLVKSNPTPEYVDRVASVFNNNGSGVRGDMAAVVKAILLDDEARNCEWAQDNFSGKLKAPIVRLTEYFRKMEFNNPDGYNWNPLYNYADEVDYMPMSSPSVFNFYTPFYTPNGPVSSAGLVAPEFQILQTRTSVGYINWASLWTQNGVPYWNWEEGVESLTLDKQELMEMSRDVDVYLNFLDLNFTDGHMSETTRDIIRDALYSWDYDPDFPQEYILQYRAESGLYLTLISPDYVILK